MKNWVKKLLSGFSSKKHNYKERNSPDLAPLEKKLGYRFKHSKLLLTALTHPSYLQESKDTVSHNQRLEFLGDSVLSLVLAERLFQIYPDDREGVLAQGRSALAKGIFLTQLAKAIGLPQHLRMSKHEERCGGRHRDSTLEDALEAVLGAIYLDSNYDTSRQIVLQWYGDIKQHLETVLAHENPKGKLQETIQGISPQKQIEYNVLETSGPDHKKTFEVEVLIDQTSMGSGRGNSKKEAEENAARKALKNIES